jgi:hypothetical protein
MTAEARAKALDIQAARKSGMSIAQASRKHGVSRQYGSVLLKALEHAVDNLVDTLVDVVVDRVVDTVSVDTRKRKPAKVLTFSVDTVDAVDSAPLPTVDNWWQYPALMDAWWDYVMEGLEYWETGQVLMWDRDDNITRGWLKVGMRPQGRIKAALDKIKKWKDERMWKRIRT